MYSLVGGPPGRVRPGASLVPERGPGGNGPVPELGPGGDCPVPGGGSPCRRADLRILGWLVGWVGCGNSVLRSLSTLENFEELNSLT